MSVNNNVIIIANVMDPSYMPGSVLSIFLLYSSEQYYEKRNVSFTSYIIKQAEEVFTLSYHIVITSRRRLNKMACGLCLPH